MRILFVTPYPPSRIRVRSYGFLKELLRNHEVTVLARCSSEQELQDVADLRAQGCNIQTVQEPRQDAVLRSGRALLSQLPLQVAYSRSTQFARAIRDLSSHHTYDVLHIEHLRGIASMQQYVFDQPLVWDAVDCISLLWRQAMQAGPDLKVRVLARVEYERTRRFEAWLMSQLQHIVITTERDRQAMLELHHQYTGATYQPDAASPRELSVIPNGVDLDYFCPSSQACRRYNLVFSGKMSYHANVASALFLCKHIMPLIWQEIPEATLTIVGYNPPESIRRLGRDPRIEVTGYVPDIRPYIQRAEVMVCPTVYSVGIQNKLLESMALGTPAVVAEQATWPLEAYPEHDLLVAGTAAQFASQTVRLLRDAELRASLGRNARLYVETKHSWSQMTDRLIDLYQQAVDQARTLPTPTPTIHDSGKPIQRNVYSRGAPLRSPWGGRGWACPCPRPLRSPWDGGDWHLLDCQTSTAHMTCRETPCGSPVPLLPPWGGGDWHLRALKHTLLSPSWLTCTPIGNGCGSPVCFPDDCTVAPAVLKCRETPCGSPVPLLSPSPQVTIIIPYSKPGLIEATLEKLVHQTYPPESTEIIVVGAGSKPLASRWPVKAIDTHAIYYPGEARNIGAAAATGEYLLFIDDDCEPASDWIEQNVRELYQSRVGAVGGQIAGKSRAFFAQCVDFSSFAFNQANRRMEMPVCSASLAVKRHVYESVGGFNQELRSGEDIDFCYRLIKMGYKVVYQPKVKVLHNHQRGTFSALLSYSYFYGRVKGLSVKSLHASISRRNSILTSFAHPLVYMLMIIPIALGITASIIRFNVREYPSVLLYAPYIFLAKVAYHLGIWQWLLHKQVDKI